MVQLLKEILLLAWQTLGCPEEKQPPKEGINAKRQKLDVYLPVIYPGGVQTLSNECHGVATTTATTALS